MILLHFVRGETGGEDGYAVVRPSLGGGFEVGWGYLDDDAA